jgi:methylmalonyl-CoA mutase C-terminal domain/subunit
MTLVPRVLEELRKMGLDHVKVFVGGIIPQGDETVLKEMGVAGIFGPGASTKAIARFIREQLVEG